MEIDTLKCDMCGGDLSSNGVCLECGMSFSIASDLEIGSPEWGKISITISTLSPDGKARLIGELNSIWSDLENTTSQKLFSGQSITFNEEDELELIGTKDSFLTLDKALKDGFDLPSDSILYEVLTLEEVYALRDS